jgi:hypothetical protein
MEHASDYLESTKRDTQFLFCGATTPCKWVHMRVDLVGYKALKACFGRLRNSDSVAALRRDIRRKPMSDAAGLPINFKTQGITGHDGYIIAEALYFAARMIDEMPDNARPTSDKRDMLKILNTAFPDWEDVFGPP